MRLRPFVGNAVVHDNVRFECRGIVPTTPTPIASNCETAESNRSWQNAMRSMAVAWASIVGSSKGRSVGCTNFAGSEYAANDVTIFIKPFSQ